LKKILYALFASLVIAGCSSNTGPNSSLIVGPNQVIVTFGRTDSISVSAGETGFGISAGSEFSSSLGLGYFYQETITVSEPRHYGSQNRIIKLIGYEELFLSNETNLKLCIS
jgi:hypothetical protein